MKILDHLFGSEETAAKEIKLDDEAIIKNLNGYLGTIPEKKLIIERLKAGSNFKTDLLALKKILQTELVDIHDEQKEEEELISDLEWMEHSLKIKRLHRLEQCLAYAETKHEYAYWLSHYIYNILKNQMHLTEKLLAGSNDPERLISHIKQQFEIELTVIKKVQDVQTFHSLFSALVKGEHMIKKLDSTEKEFLSEMDRLIYDSPEDERTESAVFKLGVAVRDAIKEKVYGAIEDGSLDNHYDANFEFVNSSRFVDLVKEKIRELGQNNGQDKAIDRDSLIKLSKMINAFVYQFRGWYNYEND
ncbi:hypothetical protein COV19_00400 [Candidatus Woesearchaeota archaeon CG10_big_fil_rev_8_21_14_0_10_44_13]|nr:MAG: hypothetical protein COV19_00400 [Candidatus Woesearchaeota archaeon CG10_big_fil_rev_8_21_14_0_10_44_13]